MSQLLIERGDSLAGEEGLSPDEEIALRNDIGKVVVSLLKAILQTSLYRTEHKLLTGAVDEFFTSLSRIQHLFHEMTLTASADEAHPDFKVEGIFAEPVPVASCLKTILKDEFLGKLQDFFSWNKLVSFSIRSSLGRDQLITFLDMATRKYTTEHVEGEELVRSRRLSGLLADAELLNISVICREDVAFGERLLPWRVRLAIARMTKNYREIPIFARATRSEIQDAKRLLMQEIIRPLRGHELLMEFMLNCDLVIISDTDLEGLDLEQEILAVLNRHQLTTVSESFINELQKPPAEDAPAQERRQKAMSLLSKCMLPLSDVLDQESMKIFRRVLDAGHLSLTELPDNVQQHINIERQADTFLSDPQAHIKKLRAITSEPSFRASASSSAMLVRELIERGEVRWAKEIVELFAAMSAEKSMQPQRVKELASQNLEAMATRESITCLIQMTDRLNREEQEHVFDICRLFRHRSAPVLIREIRQTLTEEARAGIRGVLIGVGPEIAPSVRSAIERPKQRWEYYRDLLLVLGGTRDTEGYQIAQSFLGDENPEIREAAFRALAAIGASRAEPELVRGLRAPEITVRTAVVQLLGEIRSRAAPFSRFLIDLFSGSMNPGLSQRLKALLTRRLDGLRLLHLKLLSAGCAAVTSLLGEGWGGGAKIEPSMRQTLGRLLRGELRGRSGAVAQERTALVTGIISVLALVGTARTLNVLRNARDQGSRQTRFHAERAIQQIKQREKITTGERWYARAVRWLRHKLGFS